jgi:hypothetical protein
LKSIFEQYASVEMMSYCTHPHDTQTNKALNNAIANIAPKSLCYSGTISLYSRISLVIGIHNMGHYYFFQSLFSKIRIPCSDNLSKSLTAKEDRKQKKKDVPEMIRCRG